MIKYSEYNAYNRYPNLDGLEWKIVSHLLGPKPADAAEQAAIFQSESSTIKAFWKILKYNDLNALSQPDVTWAERVSLICNDNGDPVNKRVFFAPFVDDAWTEQCSSVYIYVDKIYPVDHLKATVGVAVETVVHSKISAIAGDYDPDLNPNANPNDFDSEGNIVVPFKNRATVLLKCILAELSGLCLDGIGYLQFNQKLHQQCKTDLSLWNSRSFYGHSVIFGIEMSGVSDSPDFTFQR